MITSPFVILAYLIFIACAYVFAALALALWLIWLIGAGCVAVVKWVK